MEEKQEKEIICSRRGSIVVAVCSAIVVLAIVGDLIASMSFAAPGKTGLAFMYLGFFIFPAALVIVIILIKMLSRCELTVTDKRVYGQASFGRRIDLPFDMISVVGTGAFNSIVIATSSGKIKFYDIDNRNAIHSSISSLLIERQKKNNEAPVVRQEIPQSNADELKKFKELLDSGVISQEEFDAKKKQLLGL